jgi:hypothetical protein
LEVSVTVDPVAEIEAALVLANPEKYSHRDHYHAVLRTNHSMGSWLQMLDENEDPLWSMDNIIDGGVTFDVDQTPEMTLSITVIDTKGRFVEGGPWEEAIEARRFIRVIYEKLAPSGWMRFPLFTGPIAAGSIQRQGAQVTIQSASKEFLYLDPYLVWTAQHHQKGKKVTDAIHDIAYDMGERSFNLPDLPNRLQNRVTLKRFAEPWKIIKQLAARLGRVAYFDGDGRLSLRPSHPQNIAYIFEPDMITTDPEITNDYTQVINTAVTTGGDPKGSQKPQHISYTLPDSNPFSPSALARNGVPRRAIIQDQIESKKSVEIQKHAKSLVKLPHHNVSFDCLPVPHLRPGMLCRITGEFEDQDVDEKFLLKSGFIPLTANNPMTVGSWRPMVSNWRAMPPRHSGGRTGKGKR